MFAKLLKYDFRSTKKIGLILLLCILGAAVLGGAGIVSIVGIVESGISDALRSVLTVMLTLTIVMSVITLIIAAFVMFVYICVNFYKSLVTDEGYLTFTLPVKAKDILLSKTVNGIVWMVITVLAIIVSIFLVAFVVIFILSDKPLDFLSDAGQLISQIIREIITAFGESGTWDFVLNVILVVANLIVAGITSLLLCFTAIFTGSVIVKKNKALAAFGLVYGFNAVYGIIRNVIYSVFITASSAGSDFNVVFLFSGSNISTFILNVIATVAFFLITKNLMEKHVNLS